jgi:indolepyruvate ferredoxin oxidoreductase
VRQALNDLGLDEAALHQLGIRLMKVGCVWPLDAQDARHFAEGLDEILVVEEKRQLLEYALKEELYNWREDVRPRVYGKFDARGNAGGEWSVPRSDWLLPATAELSPSVVAKAIAKRLVTFGLPAEIRRHIEERLQIIEQKEREAARPRVTAERIPWFCSGCPHNTSTRVPQGSRALAGIGCHYMVRWMDRDTETFSHMGGEGAAWIGQMHFTEDKHIFVNLGDGTYFHSGLLAIRAAVAAQANITYKILFNDAIAMTGGQPLDGVLSVPQLAQQVIAEGVSDTVVVTDDPSKYNDPANKLPPGVSVYHRDQLDTIQRRLRDTSGTTILIYEQMCATEKRRRRKRGTYPDIARRVYINEAVCEGCGDCSKVSNCLSVEPVKTPFGTKRRINQSSCNKDFSCVNGFCPSFVVLDGAELRAPQITQTADVPQADTLPEPVITATGHPYRILITGVGGTGVVTIGALLGTAAHLEHKGVTALDMSGLAQKGGAVLSHVQFAPDPEQLHASCIALGEADLLLGCDGIVSASEEALSRTLKGLTKAVVNSSAIPTAAFVQNPDWHFPGASVAHDLAAAIGGDCEFIDANALALKLLGDTIYTNPLILGYAWQKGWIPLQQDSLFQAILANGVKVEENQQAFLWGRYFAYHGNADSFLAADDTTTVQHDTDDSLQAILARSETLLREYQNERYAQQYRAVLQPLETAEKQLGVDKNLPLSKVAATQLARLMAYKDEYEVARLYSRPEFMQQLRSRFAGEPGQDYQVKLSLSPPLLAARDARGRPRKQQYGQWLLSVFPYLARMKALRGTVFDVFGYSHERRQERQLIEDYQHMIKQVTDNLNAENMDKALQLLELPKTVRGFGYIKQAALDRFQQDSRKLRESFAAN